MSTKITMKHARSTFAGRATLAPAILEDRKELVFNPQTKEKEERVIKVRTRGRRRSVLKRGVSFREWARDNYAAPSLREQLCPKLERIVYGIDTLGIGKRKAA